MPQAAAAHERAPACRGECASDHAWQGRHALLRDLDALRGHQELQVCEGSAASGCIAALWHAEGTAGPNLCLRSESSAHWPQLLGASAVLICAAGAGYITSGPGPVRVCIQGQGAAGRMSLKDINSRLFAKAGAASALQPAADAATRCPDAHISLSCPAIPPAPTCKLISMSCHMTRDRPAGLIQLS